MTHVLQGTAPATPFRYERNGTRSAVNPLVRGALYLFVLSMPFEIPDRTIPIEIPTLFGAVFLLATLINPTASYRRIPGAVLWFGAYLWVFGLATLMNRSDQPMLVLELFLSLLQLVIILWAASNLLREKRIVRGVLIALGFACAVRALMQVLGFGVTSETVWTGGARITVLGQNPNWSAIILSAGLITLLNLRPRLLTWPLAAVTGLAIIQTGSRGGLIAVAGGLAVLLLQGRTTKARIRNACLALAGIVLLGVGVYRSDMFRGRVEQTATEHNMAGRERIYPAVLSMIAERPLLGWGPIENRTEIAQRIGEKRKDRRDAHNLILELLSSTGIMGALPFLIGLAFCVRGAWRARHGPWQMFPAALLGAVLLGSMSGTWIASKVLWLALAIAIATGATAWKEYARGAGVRPVLRTREEIA